jgi:D-alanine-D-alanine ligase
VLKKEDDIDSCLDDVGEKLGYPVFVKPANGGSSVGIFKALDRNSLANAIGSAFLYDRKIILEEAVEGRELECAVIGGYESARALGVGEIIPCNEFYDYNAKYIDDESEIIVPAGISAYIAQMIMKEAVRAFRAVDAYGLARVDFFLGKGNEIYLNEINTMPGFTNISMFPKLWRYAGGSDEALITELIELALERKEKYIFLKDYEPDD